MSGGGGPSKVGIVLIIIFAISLLMLLTQIFYVLWRRRVFRRHGGDGGDQFSQHSSSDSSFSSKELLYFFCVRPHPNSMPAPDAVHDLNSNPRTEMEVIDVELLKIHGMFGPPRFLFTIKEEEGEHTESPAAEEVKKIDDGGGSRVILQECFEAVEEPPETEEAVAVVEIDDRYWIDTTPFSTPCDSPMYFTPSVSPVHEVVNDQSTGSVEVNRRLFCDGDQSGFRFDEITENECLILEEMKP